MWKSIECPIWINRCSLKRGINASETNASFQQPGQTSLIASQLIQQIISRHLIPIRKNRAGQQSYSLTSEQALDDSRRIDGLAYANIESDCITRICLRNNWSL